MDELIAAMKAYPSQDDILVYKKSIAMGLMPSTNQLHSLVINPWHFPTPMVSVLL